jgi:hypothetical protein
VFKHRPSMKLSDPIEEVAHAADQFCRLSDGWGRYAQRSTCQAGCVLIEAREVLMSCIPRRTLLKRGKQWGAVAVVEGETWLTSNQILPIGSHFHTM